MLVVIPHAGPAGKTRLELDRSAREELSRAMLADVLAVAVEIGTTWVVTPDPEAGRPPGRRVRRWFRIRAAGRERPSKRRSRKPVPGRCSSSTPTCRRSIAADLRALAEATPASGIAVAAAEDGTTNALGLSDATLFAPLYGPGSAARFLAHAATAVAVTRPGLRDDADSLADLVRLAPRSGPRTRACLAKLVPA